MLNGLARRLVKDEVITEEQAKETFATAKRENVAFPLQLVNDGLSSALNIAKLASDEFGSPLLDLNSFNSEELPKDLVSPNLIEKHHVLPLFKRGNRLFIAASDPADLHAFDEIKFNTGLTIDAVLVEADKLNTGIQAYLNSGEGNIGDALGGLDEEDLDNLDIEAVDTNSPSDDGGNEEDEAPIVRFVNKVLLDAILSLIHI